MELNAKNVIKNFAKEALRSVTLDLIPGRMQKSYVFNSDRSAFFKPSEGAYDLSSDYIIYPTDSFVDVEKFKNEYVNSLYKGNVITAAISWLAFILFLFIPVVGVILAPIALILSYWIVSPILVLITMREYIMRDTRTLRVEAGLGKFSNNSDRIFAHTQKENFAVIKKAGNNLEEAKKAGILSSELRQKASDTIRARR